MKEEMQDKRAAVLKATLELICEQGFHGTPMSQIAKKANVSIGTIYHYFTGKDELVNALYIDIKTRLAEYALRNYSKEMPVRKAFKCLVGSIVQYAVQNPAELSFAEQYENSPLITTATHEEIMRITETMTELFKSAIEQDLLKELPLEMLCALINGSVIALAKLYLSRKVELNEEWMDAGLDAIWDMIKR